MADRTVTISELSEATGVAPSALRFYERRSLLDPVGRAGGKRVYAANAIEQVALIDLLKTAGLTLGEIADLIGRDGRVSRDWKARLRAKLDELDIRLLELERSRTILQHGLRCPHELLHECRTHQQIVRSHLSAMRHPRFPMSTTSRAPQSR